MLEFPIDFDEFPLSTVTGLVGEAGYIDGYVLISATKHDWEPGDVYVYVGHRGTISERAPAPLAKSIRDYFMARKGWVAKVDDEHAGHYTPDAIAERSGRVPSWMEPV